MSAIDIVSDQRVVLYDVPWSTYETLLHDLQPGGTKLTYRRGALEIMSPSHKHEWLKSLLGYVVPEVCVQRGVGFKSGGSTTFRQESLARGLEPDQCYWIASEPAVRGREEIDLAVDPPPDLVIEVEVTRPALDRLAMYAELGVPEIWCCDGDSIRVLRLEDDRYSENTSSGLFPFLVMTELADLLAQRKDGSEADWIRSLRKWLAELE